MEEIVRTFRRSHSEEDGYLLASTISLTNVDLERFAFTSDVNNIAADLRYELFYNNSNPKLPKALLESWVEVYNAYWKVAVALEKFEDVDWTMAVEGMKEMTQAVIRGFQNSDWDVWQLPVLYTTCKYLRYVSIRADEESQRRGTTESWKQLEDSARIINRAFNLCLNDRAPMAESRKWGTYYIINLLFKTYFRLNAVTLSKNILRALNATHTEMPELGDYPTSHVVTFKYYCGVIAFLEEDYFKAEEHLDIAYRLCHKMSKKNKELILTYLIPCKLLTKRQLPTSELLSPYPFLEKAFLPLNTLIKSGSLRDFDRHLKEYEEFFIRKRIYLTLERGRDIALRNLFRKVYLAAEVKTRVPVDHFRAAVNWKMELSMEAEEVECYLANMIYKGFMKGYISRERGMVVLSNKDAFPGTGQDEET